jgi:hypothetical protein
MRQERLQQNNKRKLMGEKLRKQHDLIYHRINEYYIIIKICMFVYSK